MQIIKDKELTDDSWQFVADDTDLPDGDLCVSLDRWKKTGQALLNRQGKLGVRIKPGDSVADLADALDKLALIELNFPKFADGRLFSLAWLLRNRHHYQGEIRAVGDFMPDQAFYLSRVGVNAFAPANPEHTPMILTHFDDFSVKYQTSVN